MSRVTRQTTQLSLDVMQRCMMKSKTDEVNDSPKRSMGLSLVKLQGSSNATSESPIASPKSVQTKGAACGAPKNVPRIRTTEEGHVCLEAAQLIEPGDTLNTDTLAGTLVQVSLFPGMSQATRDAVRAVAILMAQAMPANTDEVSTEGIMDRVVDRLADIVKTATQAAVAEIKQASTALTESSTQIAATATSDRDALKSTVAGPTMPHVKNGF